MCVNASALGFSSRSASASTVAMRPVWYGLTSSAPDRHWAAPANSLRMSVPGFSPRAAMYSRQTRFMPSRSGVTRAMSASW